MGKNLGQDRLLSRYLDHTVPNSHSALSLPLKLHQITTYGFANDERSGSVRVAHARRVAGGFARQTARKNSLHSNQSRTMVR